VVKAGGINAEGKEKKEENGRTGKDQEKFRKPRKIP